VTGDERIARGMAAQARDRQALLESGRTHLGWKVGLNTPAAQEKAGIDAPVVGFLTDATEIDSGSEHSLEGGVHVGVEPELAAHLVEEVNAASSPEQVAAAIGAVGPAVEIVDVDRDFDDLEAILAGNIFHRAVIFGAPEAGRAGGDLTAIVAELKRNGAQEWTAAAAPGYEDLGAIVSGVARRLEEVGETLRAGDRVIAGSLTPIEWVSAGDEVTVDYGKLGTVAVSFTA
jgi:2-keto-4-pentenoate hydratase